MENLKIGETIMSYEQIEKQMRTAKADFCQNLQAKGAVILADKELTALADKFGLNNFPYLYQHPLFVWGIKTDKGKIVLFRMFFEDGRPKLYTDDLGRKGQKMPKTEEEGIRISCFLEHQGQLAPLANLAIDDQSGTENLFSVVF